MDRGPHLALRQELPELSAADRASPAATQQQSIYTVEQATGTIGLFLPPVLQHQLRQFTHGNGFTTAEVVDSLVRFGIVCDGGETDDQVVDVQLDVSQPTPYRPEKNQGESAPNDATKRKNSSPPRVS